VELNKTDAAGVQTITAAASSFKSLPDHRKRSLVSMATAPPAIGLRRIIETQ